MHSLAWTFSYQCLSSFAQVCWGVREESHWNSRHLLSRSLPWMGFHRLPGGLCWRGGHSLWSLRVVRNWYSPFWRTPAIRTRSHHCHPRISQVDRWMLLARHVWQTPQTCADRFLESIYRRQNLQRNTNLALHRYIPIAHLAQANPGLRSQLSFRFFYERPKLINFICRKVKVMDEVIGHVLSMDCQVIKQIANGVTMMFRCAFNCTNSLFLDELSANFLNFSLAEFLIVKGSSFCLNKIFLAMKAKILSVPSPVDTSLDNILTRFLSEKSAFLILAHNSNSTSRSCHIQFTSVQTAKKNQYIKLYI